MSKIEFFFLKTGLAKQEEKKTRIRRNYRNQVSWNLIDLQEHAYKSLKIKVGLSLFSTFLLKVWIPLCCRLHGFLKVHVHLALFQLGLWNRDTDTHKFQSTMSNIEQWYINQKISVKTCPCYMMLNERLWNYTFCVLSGYICNIPLNKSVDGWYLILQFYLKNSYFPNLKLASMFFWIQVNISKKHSGKNQTLQLVKLYINISICDVNHRYQRELHVYLSDNEILIKTP